MSRAVRTEIDEVNSSSETESMVEASPPKISDHEIENFCGNSVTSAEVVRQMKAITKPLTQQLELLCDLLQEWREEVPSEVTKRARAQERQVLHLVVDTGLTVTFWCVENFKKFLLFELSLVYQFLAGKLFALQCQNFRSCTLCINWSFWFLLVHWIKSLLRYHRLKPLQVFEILYARNLHSEAKFSQKLSCWIWQKFQRKV